MASISEALVATAIGLFVAIPAVAAYNVFQRIIKSKLANTDVLSHVLLAHLNAEDPPANARKVGAFEGGKLMLFFGARTKEELPYFGPLGNLPKDFIDINFAFSRAPDQPKRYVQDAMRERAADLAPLIADPDSYFYVCGLKAMEEGVVLALRDIAVGAGLDWETIGPSLKRHGRLHLETY